MKAKTLVDRLRRKTVAGVPVFPTPIESEAANRIEELEAKLRLTEGAFKNTRIRELEEENAALQHDLERSMANHVADINVAESNTEVKP